MFDCHLFVTKYSFNGYRIWNWNLHVSFLLKAAAEIKGFSSVKSPRTVSKGSSSSRVDENILWQHSPDIKKFVGFSTSVLDKALFRAVLDALLKKQKPLLWWGQIISRHLVKTVSECCNHVENEEMFLFTTGDIFLGPLQGSFKIGFPKINTWTKPVPILVSLCEFGFAF